MANSNRNQEFQSYDWDRNRDRYNRRNEDDRYNDYDDKYGNAVYNRFEDRNRNDYDDQYRNSNYQYRNYDNDDNRNDWQDRNYGNNYSSNQGTSYSGNYNRQSNYNDYRNDDRNYQDYKNYGDPYSASSGNTSNYGDRRYKSYDNYNNDRNNQHRENRKDNRDRDWWDKATDEVSSWFGDKDAERRRRRDEQTDNGPHRGKGPKGYKRSDERIQENINDRLSDDSYIDASDVDVKVNNGEVVLEGTVESRQAKRRAEDIAEAVSGVSNVENHLRVKQYNTSVGGSEIR